MVYVVTEGISPSRRKEIFSSIRKELKRVRTRGILIVKVSNVHIPSNIVKHPSVSIV